VEATAHAFLVAIEVAFDVVARDIRDRLYVARLGRCDRQPDIVVLHLVDSHSDPFRACSSRQS